MNQFKLIVWTGPTAVKEIAKKCRDADITVLYEGTEHIHVASEGSTGPAACHNFLASLIQKHRIDFGLHPKVLGPI